MDDEEEEDVIEGGIADAEVGGDPRPASQADITLFFECVETCDAWKDHPLLQPGVTVTIGMGKNTKLGVVFARYLSVCAQHAPPSITIEDNDIEFVHSAVLNASDTPEAAALMKHDRISVRRERSAERQAEAELEKMQREIDKTYYTQMLQFRNIDPDVVLDCRGTCVDSGQQIQQHLSTKVKCHSYIIQQRCPWLAQLVRSQLNQRNGAGPARVQPDDGVAFIDDTEEAVVVNYPPDAVKLLLEYLYTNRVVKLGFEAYATACRTKPKTSMRRWHNRGDPDVSFDTACSLLRLAEEASMPRLSLMAEVAASELVNTSNFLSALGLCEDMRKTGNELPRLRKAAVEMVFMLRSFPQEPKLVPTLLSGTSSLVEEGKKRKIDEDWRERATKHFARIDRSDKSKRAEERNACRTQATRPRKSVLGKRSKY